MSLISTSALLDSCRSCILNESCAIERGRTAGRDNCTPAVRLKEGKNTDRRRRAEPQWIVGNPTLTRTVPFPKLSRLQKICVSNN